jgi:hypothetical protein
MPTLELDDLQGLVKQVAADRLLDIAATAGIGVTAPLVALRAREARRELSRLELRAGGDSAKVERQRGLVAELDRRQRAIDDELGRRLGPRAEPGPEQAAIDGRVMRGGVPVEGASVRISGGDDRIPDRALPETSTDRDGRFSLLVPAGFEVRLVVDADGKTLHRDEQAIRYPIGYRGFRAIEVKPADADPCGGKDGGRTVEIPSLVGLDLKRAERSLAKAGLTPGEVTEAQGAAGIVLRQAPEAGALGRAGDAVSIVIGRSVKDRPVVVPRSRAAKPKKKKTARPR